MNEEVKVSAVTKAMEDLEKDIGALHDKVNALSSHLNQVLSPELTITENKGGIAPKESVSPLLEKIQDERDHVGLIGRYVQHLIERLEV